MSIINGAHAILEGFGEAPPSQEVGQSRADSCIRGNNGNKCPFNHTGAFSITAKASQIIHAQRQRKLELKLTVDGEASLGVCKICSCFLPLKVWYDIKTIYDHTEDATLAKFPDWCWIKRECSQLKTT